MIRRLAVITACALPMVACSGVDDPSRAGFLDSVNILMTGRGEERLQERRTAYADARSDADRVGAEAGRLDSRRRDLAREEQNLRTRIASLGTDLEALRRQIGEAERSSAADRSRLAALQRRTEDLKREQARLAAQPSPDSEELRELERQNQELRRAIVRATSGVVAE